MSLPKRAPEILAVDWHAHDCSCPICRPPHPADAADRHDTSRIAKAVIAGMVVGQGLCLALDLINGTRGVAAFWGL